MTRPSMNSPDDSAPAARSKSGSEPEYRRPGQATAAAVVLIVIGALGVLLALQQLAELGSHGERVHAEALVLPWLTVALSVALVVSGIFVLPGRHNWARLLGITFAGLNLLAGVVTLFTGNVTAFLGIAVNIGLIVMLTRQDVVFWCER